MEEKKMLDNLIESKKNSAENRRLGRYLLTTFVLVFTLALSGVLWSLFAKDFGVGSEDLELSNLVTPIPIIENKPEPEPLRRPENSQPNQTNNEISRQTNTQRIEETPLVPKDISVTPNTQLARPKGDFKITSGAETNYTGSLAERGSAKDETGFSDSTKTAQVEKPEITIPKPPPPIRKSETEVTKKPPTISGGVVNGKATSLPKPPYPPAARAVGAGGKVDVQVTIDENGSVVSAKAISGHPLLRDTAERAARNAKFSPTYLTDKRVKVSGLIVYNFTKN
jgi:periplasmic protein TonB